MPLDLLSDRIAIKADPETTESSGWIIIPADSRDKVQAGTIINHGIGRTNKDGNIRPWPDGYEWGNRVLFEKFAGTEIEINGDKLLLMRERDILAKIEVNQ
jgi:chaperonin GroES